MEKIIHYFWFGGKEKPEIVKKCIASWKTKMPDWRFQEWNEDNYDVNQTPYSAEAYQAQKYAFVSDYARCKVLYQEGGVYLDTDVEVLKPLDDLLENGTGFMGFELDETVAPGLIMGAEKGNVILREMCEIYEATHFQRTDGSYDMTTIVEHATGILRKHGLIPNGEKQVVEGITIYPKEYFAPYNVYTEQLEITENTYSVHHYTATWQNIWQKRFFYLKKKCKLLFGAKNTMRIIALKRKIRDFFGHH